MLDDSATRLGPATAMRAACLALLLLPAGCGWGLSDVERGIRQLPRQDRDAARRQQTCPLTGSTLGQFAGKPVKLNVRGEQFFVCCGGCAAEVRSDLVKFVLGLRKPPVPPGAADRSRPDGAPVHGVVEGSPAAKAGILSGDVITRINATPVDGWASANSTLAATTLSSDGVVAVELLRGEATRQFELRPVSVAQGAALLRPER